MRLCFPSDLVLVAAMNQAGFLRCSSAAPAVEGGVGFASPSAASLETGREANKYFPIMLRHGAGPSGPSGRLETFTHL